MADADRIVQVLRITRLSGPFAVHSSVRGAITAGRHWHAAISGDGGNAAGWCRDRGLL